MCHGCPVPGSAGAGLFGLNAQRIDAYYRQRHLHFIHAPLLTGCSPLMKVRPAVSRSSPDRPLQPLLTRKGAGGYPANVRVASGRSHIAYSRFPSNWLPPYGKIEPAPAPTIIMTNKLPSVVIVGRPNVGKSTLFNRLTGTRRSIVTDEPGITRDRIYGRSTWSGKPFEVVDTGGMILEENAEIPREIVRQAEVAIADATELVLVVDARAGLNPLDEELARRLKRTGKPLLIAANKADTFAHQTLAADFHGLGGDVFPISAEHGTGIDDLLDAITKDFSEFVEPAEPVEGFQAGKPPAEIQVAIIGRPNVGKSTLLNTLAGAERSIVSAVPGTTRDAVDTDVQREGKDYRFVDTAGIRRKGKTTVFAEKLSVIMARKHLERADVALILVDASVGVTAGDATIAGYAHESGRSVIIVMNKWDLAMKAARTAAQLARKGAAETVVTRHTAKQLARVAGPASRMAGKGRSSGRGREADDTGKRGGKAAAGRRHGPDRADAPRNISTDPVALAAEYEILVRDRLKFLPYAPIIFVSALTGEDVSKLYALIDHVAESRFRHISTGELNRWLANEDLTRGTSPSSRRVKIYYVTQAASAPPTFILFTNQRDRLHFSYERFLENRLREAFDFSGTPIRFIQRLKERGHRERSKVPERPRRRAPR